MEIIPRSGQIQLPGVVLAAAHLHKVLLAVLAEVPAGLQRKRRELPLSQGKGIMAVERQALAVAAAVAAQVE